MNLPNTPDAERLVLIDQLQRGRGFFPTDRQRDLYNALLSAPCPPESQNSGADHLTLPRGDRRTRHDAGDRLTLLGYGGAMGGGKTRAIVELAIDADRYPVGAPTDAPAAGRARRRRGLPRPTPAGWPAPTPSGPR